MAAGQALGVSKVILGVALAIGLLFAPLTAAAALVALIVANFDAVKGAVLSAWDSISDFGTKVGDFFTGL